MSLLGEFKEFAVKGNVLDLAVGVIIGAAFGKIVSSMVGDVIMPVVGLAVGGVDFTTLALTLKAAEGATPAVSLKYGQFLQNVFDFLVIAASVFVMVRAITSLKRESPKPVPVAREATPTEDLLREIRDLIARSRRSDFATTRDDLPGLYR